MTAVVELRPDPRAFASPDLSFDIGPVTRLDVPLPPVGLVARPRLQALLRDALEHPVTLVRGPAGSGKTTLVGSCFAAAPGPIAWVSLGAGVDPDRIWAAVLMAFHRSGAAPDGSELGALAPPASGTGADFVSRLVNALAETRMPVVLVLDDLDRVTSADWLGELELLTRHAPSALRIVLVTRSEPSLGLHRLRLHGSLGEIDVEQLAFTPEETLALLAAQGVERGEGLAADLCARTEGWAAGLRLASLALRTARDPAEFVDRFGGDDRTVEGYLCAEFLDEQGLERRRFLLRTSIVDEVCGSLAECLTGDSVAASTLVEIERTSGMIRGVGSRAEWFRYPRLLAQTLRTRAEHELGSELEDLHARAARWYGERGHGWPAIRHAVAAGDGVLTKAMLADHWADTRRDHGVALDDLVRARPPIERVAIHAGVGAAALRADDRERAYAELRRAVSPATGDAADAEARGELALVELDRSGPSTARETAEDAVRIAAGAGSTVPPTALLVLATCAFLELRLDDAEAGLTRTRAAAATAPPDRYLDLRVTWLEAMLDLAGRRPADGLRRIERFELFHPERPSGPGDSELRTGLRARLHLACGDGEAADAALAAADHRTAEVALVQARRRLAAGDPEGAVDRLEQARAAPDACLAGVQVEREVLMAVARETQGDPRAAEQALERAFGRAETFGHRWPFVDAGRRVEALIERAIRAGTAHRAVAGELLDAVVARQPSGVPTPLLEPLSARETVVLRYLPTVLSNREIADELFVTTNTVKSHVRSIYRKLDVSRRRDAIARARELRLLARAPR